MEHRGTDTGMAILNLFTLVQEARNMTKSDELRRQEILNKVESEFAMIRIRLEELASLAMEQDSEGRYFFDYLAGHIEDTDIEAVMTLDHIKRERGED